MFLKSSGAVTLILALSCIAVSAQDKQPITNPDSQGYGTNHCLSCGNATDPASEKEGLEGNTISTCFLTYGELADGDNSVGAINTVFECSCKPAFVGNGLLCENVNECDELTDWCDNNAKCIDTPGSFKCECDKGYNTTDEGKTCEDIDECDADVYGSHVCGMENGKGFGECKNSKGSYSCDCNKGFRSSNTNKTDCINIDECVEDKGAICNGTHQGCTDTTGSYVCYCGIGYQWNDQLAEEFCIDMDECIESPEICGSNSDCGNTDGNYTCTCKDGYRSDNNDKNRETDCKDIDECDPKDSTFNCTSSNQGQCINTDGGYTCGCNSGYKLFQWRFFGAVQELCRDVDECEDPNLNYCSEYADCTDTEGSYSCSCKSGFTGDGRQCTDIDECGDDALSQCDDKATCTNYPGGFNCTCIYGYAGDGKSCSEVGGSIDDLQRNRTDLTLYSMRVQIHQEDVYRQTLMVDREILLRKCALLENGNSRKRRAVTEYDGMTEEEATIYLKTLQAYNSALRLANHALEINCNITVIGNNP